MDVCSTCGAVRHRIGVLYPARLLCRCETRQCHCGKPAVMVEFQVPVKLAEPKLPAKSNGTASFLCAADAPGDFPLEAAKAPKAEAPRKKGLPNVDPIWASEFGPPVGATSTQRVQCAACGDSHELRQRKMWNGTHSKCPKCGDEVYTPAWGEEKRHER